MSSTTRSINLVDASIAQSTQHKYNTAWNAFLHFCSSHLHHYSPTHHPSQLDQHLTTFINYLCNSGGSYDTAKNAVCAVKRKIITTVQLKQSNLALKGWIKLKSDNKINRAPLTHKLSNLIAIVLAVNGEVGAAVATVIGFHCYLRVGELCDITLADVALAGDLRMDISMATLGVIRLKRTKTGNNQQVALLDPVVVSVLRRWCHQFGSVHSPHIPLFGVSRSRYQYLFKRAVTTLGLVHLPFSPHSLRHGGATHDFLRGIPPATIAFRGRWASTKSLTTYVQAGAVFLLLQHSIPIHVQQIAQEVTICLERLMFLLMMLYSTMELLQ